MRNRIILGLGLGLSCLMDISLGLFFTYLISKVMGRPVSIWTYSLGACLILSPDLDAVFQEFFSSERKINIEHRAKGLHYPIIVLPIFVSFSLISWFWALLAGFCFLIHFVHDSIGCEEGAIKWLWPFSQKYFKFFDKVNGKRSFIRSLSSDEIRQLSLSLSLEKWIETYYLRPTPELITGVVAFVLAIILVIFSL